MTGLQRICKQHGSVLVTDRNGNKTAWVWDSKKGKAVTKKKARRRRDSEPRAT